MINFIKISLKNTKINNNLINNNYNKFNKYNKYYYKIIVFKINKIYKNN